MDIKKSQRVEWIDAAKGLGILLVIAGHSFFNMYCTPIYAFHMPLFFFLSGLVFNEKKYSSINGLVKAKAFQLLRPWAVCYMVSLVITLLIPVWRDGLSWKVMLEELYTVNTNSINNSSIWYLVCLFFTFLFLYGINYLMDRLDRKKAAVIIVLFGIFLLWLKDFLLFVSQSLHLIGNRLLFKMDSAMIACIFMYVGFRYKDVIHQLIANTSVIKLVIAFIAFLIGVWVNRWSNINGLDFGNYRLLYYPIAFLGIYCVLSFCYLISRTDEHFSRIRKVLVFYGINCLGIFCFQSLFIRLYILAANEYLGLSMVLYGNNPMVHQICCFMVVSFIISPILVAMLNKLQNIRVKVI